MSLSSQTIGTKEKLVSPCTKYIEFNGKLGIFDYWDKKLSQRVPIKFPITFTVLDQLASVKGWNDKNKVKIYSNEIRDSRFDELTIRTFSKKDKDGKETYKGEVIAKGLYQEVKTKANEAGAEWVSSVYAFMNGEIVNFQIKGAALGSWIEKGFDTSKKSVFCKGTEDKKKGAVEFKSPIFKPVDMKDLEAATEADKELQAYLALYFANAPANLANRPIEDTRDAPVPSDEGVFVEEVDFDTI